MQEGKLSLNPHYCWVDVWAFERILELAHIASSTGNEEQTLELIKRALNLHKGIFLAADLEQPWAMPMREHLRSKYIHQLEDLGEKLELHGDAQHAIEWYLKGLEVDVLAEPFYQGLMRSYQKMDRNAEGIEVYQRCFRTLTSSLGVKPSSATKEIYRELRQHQSPLNN